MLKVIKFLVPIATFDLIDTEDLDELLYYFPEEDPFNAKFGFLGYDSSYLAANLGFMLWIIKIHFILLLILPILIAIRCTCLG